MIQSVCVIGGGVIGSLYAGHLADVADVDEQVHDDEDRAGDDPEREKRKTQHDRLLVQVVQKIQGGQL